MRHILFIDSLEKLEIKKDSTLQLALTLKEMGREVYLLFEENFFFSTHSKGSFNCASFEGAFFKDSFSISHFKVTGSVSLALDSHCLLHMRIDPPFDTRYLRYLWMLKALKEKYGLKILNDPEGILIHNEKMICYESQESVETYVGSSELGFMDFLSELSSKAGGEKVDLIYKPLDLFQGLGVEKVSAKLSDSRKREIFCLKRDEFKGPVVVQPFLKEVEKGEIRAIFFGGRELGSILKIPQKGEFLANIARGASFKSIELSSSVKRECQDYCHQLRDRGVVWVAFDILGDKIQEANITCPGLLVEVSNAVGRNLAIDLVHFLESA